LSTSREVQAERLDATLKGLLGPRLLEAIFDPLMTDIMLNEDGRVWYEAHGRGLTEAGFTIPANQTESLIGTVAAVFGTVANADHPIVEGELPIGRIRFEGLMPPIVRQACWTMRLPARVLYTIEDYLRDGIITERQAGAFRDAVDRKLNLVISGGTGSGKTTFAGAVINEMVFRSEPNERFVLLEDTPEIQCRAQNLLSLRTDDHASIDMTRLVRTTMRLRPTRIIVGETRGGEALALLKAWSTGHPGGVTTVHSNSAREALTRLDHLVEEAGVPRRPELSAETIQLVAFIQRTPEGRRVTELIRVQGYSLQTGFIVSPV
jgi:type IV secretion system protein TrbB